ncbi:hypothetical protein GBW32_23195 [Streptomyces tsukubensis]|uniref:Uncharacterized protein n=1 Tax=Streptomyces tsukubensis TaxID=83656 RepID=A0A1V4A318_9ACTN|nr:hypothetical protein B1H18_25020 [Streptomyces tsukubensis]QFR97966.1 hypothetical protein GBW32_23195 [Streptomyces tsukubensis]
MLALGGTVLLSACGIRPTEVPTDFGAAPSRVPCVMDGDEVVPQSATGLPVQVFLVCASQLVTVDRTVRISAGRAATDRVRVAQALLDELQEPPSSAEKRARFSTDVRGGMTVSGARAGDPDDTLRLSSPPEDLTAFALSQIVCTYAKSAAADTDGSVVLGGPGDAPLRRYECTDEVRTRPGMVPTPARTVR